MLAMLSSYSPSAGKTCSTTGRRACRAAGLRRGSAACHRPPPMVPIRTKYCVPIGFTDGSPSALIGNRARGGEVLSPGTTATPAARWRRCRSRPRTSSCGSSRVHVRLDVRAGPTPRSRIPCGSGDGARRGPGCGCACAGLVELALHVRDEGLARFLRRLRVARRRHELAAQLAHGVFPGLGIVRNAFGRHACRRRRRRPSPWRCGTCEQ